MNKTRLPELHGWLNYPKRFFCTSRSVIITVDNLMNFRGIPEKYRYVVNKFVRILHAMHHQGARRRITNDYLAKQLHCTDRQIRRDLQKMEDLGLLRRSYIHYRGGKLNRRGLTMPWDTHRFIHPCIKFEYMAPVRSPEPAEWIDWLLKIGRAFAGTSGFRYSGVLEYTPDGRMWARDIVSREIIRELKPENRYTGTWKLPDGRVVEVEDYIGRIHAT